MTVPPSFSSLADSDSDGDGRADLPLGQRSFLDQLHVFTLDGTSLTGFHTVARSVLPDRVVRSAPVDFDPRALLVQMEAAAPDWLAGCRLRPCHFEPTFQKHAGQLCHGLQIHVDDPHYDHAAFRPWRVVALALKSVRALHPGYPLWRDFAYEYVHDRLAIDVIPRCANGSTTTGRVVQAGGREGRACRPCLPSAAPP